MVNTSKVTPDFSVSGQISVSDVADLAAQGFRSLICNRPDGEQAGQPSFRDIAEAAKAAGLEAVYVPVVSGRMTAVDVDAFRAALAKLPAPVLAYCRSGTRSLNIYSVARG
ncbi:MAG: TIGR01244 family sulfur transferase [Hyphomicrobiaceae bacterium]